MAATTSTPSPRKTGFDFAALSASAGQHDRENEVARLRAALETLAELVVAHGVMDARTLESIVGDLIRTPMVPLSLSAPLPPPAPSAAEALLRGPIPKPAPVAARPTAARPVAAPKPAPVAAQPAPKPVVVAPAPVAAPAPAPVAAPAPLAQSVPMAITSAPSSPTLIEMPAPSVQPVVASPFPSEPAPFRSQPAPSPALAASPSPAPAPAPARKNPFDTRDAARVEAELTESTPPALKPQGFFARLFGKPKTSPAAVAKAAASIEFTERVTKSPFEGLYSEQQRATELSFPPTESVRKPRAAAAAAPKKKAARPVNTAPARFCDRCWRRMDASGTCKTCSPLASA